jgi:hypothetical protein
MNTLYNVKGLESPIYGRIVNVIEYDSTGHFGVFDGMNLVDGDRINIIQDIGGRNHIVPDKYCTVNNKALPVTDNYVSIRLGLLPIDYDFVGFKKELSRFVSSILNKDVNDRDIYVNKGTRIVYKERDRYKRSGDIGRDVFSELKELAEHNRVLLMKIKSMENKLLETLKSRD